jgi:hypothetical protein
MSASDVERLENDLRAAGQDFAYPPTPQLAARVVARLSQPSASRRLSGRWAWAVVAILVLLSALMLVPPARAAILDFIQIGVVRIFRGPGSPPAPVPVSTGTPAPALQIPLTATPVFQMPRTATPPSSTIPSLKGLAGETTLSEAGTNLSFPILLPAYPSNLELPDKVYLQDLGGQMLVMVWLDPAHADRVRMSLHEIAADSWAITKFNPPVIQEAKVKGQRAIWTEGPYMLQTQNGNYEDKRLVEGHVLIWTQGQITYRLETDLQLDEAIRIADSLKPLRSTGIPIPADLDHAQALVHWLGDVGIGVLAVQHSTEGSLFQSANQAAWIKTDLGIADAVFFLGPAQAGHIQVTPLQSQAVGRHLYKVQAPPPMMLDPVTMDAAYPLYFTVRHGLFIETSSLQLNQALRRLPAEIPVR